MAAPATPTPAMAQIPADLCSHMVNAAARSCEPLPPIVSAPPNPNWDAMATSFASLSNAFAWGSVLLGAIAIIAALAWGRAVGVSAEREAKKMAKECADSYIQSWLSKEAPGIIRERVDFILDATLGPGDDAKAADDIGKEA